MIRISKTLVRLSAVTIVGAAALLWNGQSPLDPNAALVSSAEARIGRPLTPMSYAGVARRTTRRAVAVGAAAAGAAYAAPVVVAPAPVVVAPVPAVPGRCVQAVDPYGRIYTRCY
jgi:hypothetical protein